VSIEGVFRFKPSKSDDYINICGNFCSMYDALAEFGLSENEQNVYLFLLKIGSTTANRISSISGIKRSTTYDALASLITKGIVSVVTSDSVQYYTAADPIKLVSLIEEKRLRLAALVPQLQKIAKENLTKGGVTYFEGKKGVVTVLNDVLDSSPKSFIFMGSRKKAKIALAHYPDNFAIKRVDAGIKASGFLATEDKSDAFITNTNAEKLSRFKYSSELNRSSAIMFVTDEKLSFITNREDPVGIIINNSDVATFMKTICLWLEKKKK